MNHTKKTKPLFMARLAGTQEEMGAQHGRLVAGDARELVEFYRTMPERSLVGAVPGRAGKVARVVVRGAATAWQANLTRSRPADLLARSRAFLEASFTSASPSAPLRGLAKPGLATGKRDRIALYTLATMDSMQNCVSVAARRGLGPFATMMRAGDELYRPDLLQRSALAQHVATRAAATAAPACTSVIAWGSATSDGELLFGRNFDFPGIGVWDAAPAFVINAPTGGQKYAFFARRGADTAVVTVVNEAGLVIAPHTRWHVGAAWSGAMIIDVVHDIARRAETLEDAIRIARERPISSTWGIAIGSAREKSGIVLEIAGPQVEVVRPAAGASFLVCANRYRSESLQAGQVAATSAWALHSERRERRMRALVESRTSPLTAEMIAGFMGNRRDIDAPDKLRRLGSVLAQATNVHCAVVAPAAQRALVGVDQAPCCEGTWAEVSWAWNGPLGGWELGALPADAGIRAKLREDLVAPHDEAVRLVHEAARAYEGKHDVATARDAIERAVALAPDDPSLRLSAAWLAHASDDLPAAAAQIEAGLALETDVYRRGQLLLWGVRVARTSDPARAARWSDELTRIDHPLVDELKAAAKRPYRKRPAINLMMADAY
jgi:hypothetical protein